MATPSTAEADQLLASGIKAHQSGQHQAAEKLYREVITLRPADAQALYLLGAIYYQTKAYAEARAVLEKSLQHRPSDLAAQSMLGAVCALVGDTAAAVQYLRRVAEASPASVDAQYNYARALFSAKDHPSAIVVFLKVLAVQPAHAAALNGLMTSYRMMGRHDDAIAYLDVHLKKFPNDIDALIHLSRSLIESKKDASAVEVLERALNLNPNEVNALLLLGNVHHRGGRAQVAESYFRRLIVLAPNDVLAQNYMGSALVSQDRYAEAEDHIQKAFQIDPTHPEVLTNFGLLRQAQGRTEEAIEFQRKALALNPGMAEAWNNLGMSLQHQHQHEESLACFERAVELKPEFDTAKTNKAHVLLALGRLSEGWPTYHFRFTQKFATTKARKFPYPHWNGEPDPGATLLLWTDQGLGDEVLYSSMVADAAQRVGRCILECSPRVAPLMQRSFPNVSVVPRQNPPSHDIEAARPTCQLSLSELGGIFRPSVASIPRHDGYLKADNDARDQLRARYEHMAQGRRIVGISWKSTSRVTGRFKSAALTEWKPVFDCANVMFVSLQYGPIAEDVAAAERELGVHIVVDADVNPIDNPDLAAAQIGAMDLVISTSNSTAHFTGALNVPGWVMLPDGPGLFWYWFLNGTDSPWYPSLKLFRQEKAGTWSDTLARVGSALRAWAA